MESRRPRMLAVIVRFKWVHISYIKALEEHFDVRVAWSGEGGRDAPLDGLREGLQGAPIGWVREVGADEVRSRLEREIAEWDPDVVHVMYYNHDDVTLMARELVPDETTLVYECRDPNTTLTGAGPDSDTWATEGEALRASDAQVFVSRALRSYLEEAHDVDLDPTSLIVPNGFARDTIAPPSAKLSAADGRTHMALVGTADDQPDHGRWYGEIIQRLLSAGLVVHSHFFDLDGVSLEPYRELARAHGDYHFHPTVSHRNSTELSELVSRYDLMGVFHELEASHHNESATLAVCLPTKAVCGWLHAGIPVVCYPHYRGVVERIDELGNGFVVDNLEDVGRVAADRKAIAAATRRSLDTRDRFTNEWNAARVREFVGGGVRR
jgi:hypothetical protein